MGATVLATTRQSGRLGLLRGHGIEHPLVDTGAIADRVRQLYPDGVDAALELVGTPTLPDTLRSVRVHGTVCFTGLLSNQWTVKDFYPIDYIPAGVRLTAYGGDATDRPRSHRDRNFSKYRRHGFRLVRIAFQSEIATCTPHLARPQRRSRTVSSSKVSSKPRRSATWYWPRW